MHLADRILLLPPAPALLLGFAFAALEASAFVELVVPGEIGVLPGGVQANQGKFALWAVLAADSTGAITGDSIWYWVGKRWGEALLSRMPNRLLKHEHHGRPSTGHAA